MDVNRKELLAIKEALKVSPRGLTVTEVSKAVNMNRHSVAKYLEVLVTAGHVEMKSFGPSKVYYLSQRVPMSAMLSFTSDLILILDRDLRVRNLNDTFLKYAGLKREEIINKNIEYYQFTEKIEPPLIPAVKDALNGKESTINAYYKNGDIEFYFVIKLIPTVFEDGQKGATVIASDYTEHRRIEKTIRESERKFRNMLEQSTDGIIMSDERGVIIEYNDSLERLTGYAKSDVVGKYVWDLAFFREGYDQIPDKPHVSLKNYTALFMEAGLSPLTSRYNSYDITRPDGTIRTVQANIFPIKAEKGYVLCAIVRDITELKRAETAIKDSEEKFRSVVEQSMDGIVLADEKGMVIEFNGQLEKITGLKRKDILGKPAWEAFSPAVAKANGASLKSLEELSKHITLHGDASSTDERKYYEFDIIKPDKSHHTLQAAIFWINMEKGRILCGIVRDITGQKQAEKLLREEHSVMEARVKERTIELEAEIEKRKRIEGELLKSESKYRNLTENINDVVWEKNKDGVFTYMSPKIRDLLGYEPSDFIGKTIMDFMPRADADAIREAYWQMFREPAVYSMHETRVIHKDGHEVITEANGTPWFDENGQIQGYRGVTRDITKRKRMEEMLKQIADTEKIP